MKKSVISESQIVAAIKEQVFGKMVADNIENSTFDTLNNREQVTEQ